MKNHINKIITVVLLLLMVAVFPVISQAEDQPPVQQPAQTPEQKPAQTQVQQPAEQKPDEDKVTGEIDFSVLSAYIWRGYEQTRDSVVIEPSVTIGYKGFSLNVWGNMDTRPYSVGDAQYASQYTETDYTLSYSRKFGILQVTPGYIYYALGAPYAGAAAPPAAQEVFLNLGLDTILQPTLTAYKDIDHYREWYFLLGVSHTFEFNKVVSLKLAASASYLLSTDATTYAKYDSNSVATTDKFNNFHDGTASVSLPIAVYKTLSVTPILSYVFPLSDDAKYEMKAKGLEGVDPTQRNSTYLYGGVTLSCTF